MTRRFTLILAMLLSFTLGAVAQQVASSPTTDITSGYYVLCVSSDNGNATASYLYASDDNKVFYDAVGSEKKLAGSTIDESTAKYLFYVTKNSSGTIYVSLWSNHDLFWPIISESGTFKTKPGVQDQFTMNSSKGEFTLTAKGNAFILSLTSHFRKNLSDKTTTGYVVLNSKQQVGYNDENNKVNDNEKAKVQFYAVSGTPLNLTYNFTTPSGTVLKSETHTFLFSGVEYPAYSSDWSSYFAPYYINVPAVPSGKVKANETSYTITLSQATLPFETDKYYYFGTAGSDPVMISNNDSKSVSYRSKAQAEVLNDIEKDLWYVTGNVFDGFKFINASAGNLPALSSKGINAETGWTHTQANGAVLAFVKNSGSNDENICTIWDIKKSTSGFLVYSHKNGENGSEFTMSGEEYGRFWSYTSADGVKFNGDDGTVKEFALYEPEFTFNMNPIGNASYNSIALPFAAKPVEGETTGMYSGVLNAAQTALNLTEEKAVPANTGVLLIGDKGTQSVKLVAVKSADNFSSDNILKGTLEDIANTDLSDKLIFGISDANANEVGFFLPNSTTTVYANHAYLDRSSVASVKSLSLHIGGEPTGITLPVAEETNSSSAPVYDLSGRRVTSTVKGHLYIQNGRKFIAE